MSVRIIRGKLHGLQISAPKSARPTLVRHRQLIFDTLETIEQNPGHFFDDKVVIDCFAGSGALGIEAVSRGAKHAYLIDQNHEATTLLHENTQSVAEYFTIIRADLFKLRNNKHVTCDVAFIDPPYGKISIESIVESLRKNEWVDENTWLVIEEDAKQKREIPYNVVIEKVAGNSVFRFAKI